ncbi:MAG: FGGY-family carbohydrate kinase, partial [Pseudomonadota bacterium]
MKKLLIGIDAGTSVIKAVAFDLDGAQVAMASRRNSYASLPGGGVEQDMLRTYADTCDVLREVADKACGEVLALAVTGQGDGTWLVDSAGAPVHDGWLWLDARAAQEAKEIEASSGIDTIYGMTGTGVNVCQMRTHMRWMQRHAPDLLERAASAFHCKDWLYYRLTGQRAADPSEACFTFGSFRERAYSEDVFEALGLTALRPLLPPIVDGISQAHSLTGEAATATGLREGTPVVLGYVDVMCCGIGAGLYDPNVDVGLSILGSTGMHQKYVAHPDGIALNENRSGYTMPVPGAGLAQMQTHMAGTLNVDWMLDLALEVLADQGVARSQADLLKGLDDKVLNARPGAVVYHPYISSAGERGPFANPQARASLSGLDQSIGWFDLVRGVYDGIAMAVRDCYGAMGGIPAEIRLCGGAARSVAIRKILASALERPVRTVSQEEAGAIGAVMIAAVQQGIHADIGAASRAWVLPHLRNEVAASNAVWHAPIGEEIHTTNARGDRRGLRCVTANDGA